MSEENKASRKSGVKGLQNTKRSKDSKNKPKTRNRIDWETHHALISTAYLQLFNELQRPPTGRELAQRTKLSRKTVVQHLAGKQLDPILEPLRVLGLKVMASITKRAIEEGHVESAKLYFEKVWESGSMVEVKMTIDELRERGRNVSMKDKLITDHPSLSGLVEDGKA